MSDNVYKIVELAGASPVSIEDAIQAAITRASESLHGLRWFEVKEMRGSVQDGKVRQYQVVIKVGFTLDG
jgi:flavin-binding protein dodecin